MNRTPPGETAAGATAAGAGNGTDGPPTGACGLNPARPFIQQGEDIRAALEDAALMSAPRWMMGPVGFRPRAPLGGPSVPPAAPAAVAPAALSLGGVRFIVGAVVCSHARWGGLVRRWLGCPCWVLLRPDVGGRRLSAVREFLTFLWSRVVRGCECTGAVDYLGGCRDLWCGDPGWPCLSG